MIILLMAVTLTCFGVVMVYSASSVMAAKKFHDGFYFLKRQGIFALLGFGVMVVAMRIDYHVWKKVAVPLFFGCFVLLLLVFMPGIGGTAKGASRWIRLPGFNFQPSELAKMALIIYMAYSLDKRQEKLKLFMSGFLPYMVILAVILAVLLLKQHDMGAALTMVTVAIVMLFAAGTRLQYILGMVLVALPFVCYLVMTEAYRLRRITAFLDPWQDPTDTGFQIIQSWLALGTGGIFGQGLGEGKQKLFYLPEAHTDFILSVVGEELGFVGVIVIACHVPPAGAAEHPGGDRGRGQLRPLSRLRDRGAARSRGLRQHGGGHRDAPHQGAGAPLHQLRRQLADHHALRRRRPAERLHPDAGDGMRLVIAGGGTGGHLFPGIAVAEEFLARETGNEVLFVGTEHGIEARVLPRLGYRLALISASGMQGKGGRQEDEGRWAMLLYGYAQSRKILKEFRPDLVLGVGGYASAPLVLAAAAWGSGASSTSRTPSPASPTRSWRASSRRVFISLRGVGELLPQGKDPHDRQSDPEGDPAGVAQGESRPRSCNGAQGSFRLLVFGGSAGAHSINPAIIEALPYLAEVPGPAGDHPPDRREGPGGGAGGLPSARDSRPR